MWTWRDQICSLFFASDMFWFCIQWCSCARWPWQRHHNTLDGQVCCCQRSFFFPSGGWQGQYGEVRSTGSLGLIECVTSGCEPRPYPSIDPPKNLFFSLSLSVWRAGWWTNRFVLFLQRWIHLIFICLFLGKLCKVTFLMVLGPKYTRTLHIKKVWFRSHLLPLGETVAHWRTRSMVRLPRVFFLLTEL